MNQRGPVASTFHSRRSNPDGKEPYKQRWPLRISLPFAFDEPPREVQFSVLFAEWERTITGCGAALLLGGGFQ
jgi:hypothetical protein